MLFCGAEANPAPGRTLARGGAAAEG